MQWIDSIVLYKLNLLNVWQLNYILTDIFHQVRYIFPHLKAHQIKLYELETAAFPAIINQLTFKNYFKVHKFTNLKNVPDYYPLKLFVFCHCILFFFFQF